MITKLFKQINKPLIWGIIYLFLIPTFAIVYYYLPNSFYQSTYEVEKYNNGFGESDPLEYEICKDICGTLRQSFKTRYKRDYDSVKTKYHFTEKDTIENHLIIEPVENGKVYLEAEKLKFYLFHYKKDSTYEELELFFPTKPTFETTNQREYDNRLLSCNDSNIINDKAINLQRLFPMDGSYQMDRINNHFSSDNGFIKVSKPLQQSIYSLSFGLNSVMRKKDFSKMFYLSAVTITTLGFGDIVPITKVARTLISIEAILGIIIIGLFLNSIVTKLKK